MFGEIVTIFLLIGAVRSVHYHDPTLDQTCVGATPGLYPVPTDCSKYIVCNAKQQATVKSCGKDLHFDPDYKICVWKGIYDCKGKNFCKGKTDGDYKDDTRCDGFIKCVGGLTYKTDCPRGLWYNVKTNRCDWPKNVDCKVQTTSRPTRQTTRKLTTRATMHPTITRTWTYCSRRKDGNYIDPTRCDGYIACVAGRMHKMDCPKGLWYNVKTDRCDWPKNVDCKTTTAAPETTARPTTTSRETTRKPHVTTRVPSTYCSNKKNGNYIDPSRCDGFITCVAGVVHKMDCPKGLWYNVKTNACDWPKNVQCGATTAAPKTTARLTTTSRETTRKPHVTTRVPSTYCSNKKNGNYVDPSRCDGFITCVAGVVHKMDCPKGLWYNVKIDACDWPKNVQCGGSTTVRPSTTVPRPSTTNAQPTKHPVRFNCQGKLGNYPNPTSCSSFITCKANGKAVITYCPKGLHFHPKYGVCVWDYNYPCINGKGVAHTCVGKNDGNYADPMRCDGYIACVGGLRYPMNCPSGLWYNAKYDQCDYKYNVKCIHQTKKSITSISHHLAIPSDFCKTRKDGNYRNPKKCTGYVSCHQGYMTEIDCPANLWYDPSIGQCNYPKDVDCKVATTTKFTCKGKKAGGYEAKHRCNQFYVCDGNIDEAVVKTCPKHTNFYPPNRVCVWSYSYSCEDPDYCVGRLDGRYANENNCYGFYDCSSGRTFPNNCETGMRFNGVACVHASKYICP